jgi:predicted NUDIX family NTP pyrophosphohydrolase
MAWLYVHPAGPLMLRYKGGAWAAELKGRRLGRWSRPEDAALALQ